ncbi:MAG: SPASM domain-containing protein, partial [Thermoplasmata archaeon]|nr:SPASM domain-containing protein [Thermoplasmata archaeon]
PCPYLPLKVGSVREKPFSEIWKHDVVMNKMRTLEYSGSCGACDYKSTCGGCRARAYFYDGDYMAEEPWCSYKGGLSSD